MEPAYRAILDRRRDQLQQQVPWSGKLTRGLVQKALLTKDEVKKIELEKEDNRVYLMVTKLATKARPDVFPVFCHLLKETGNQEIAESLMFDKDRIKWNFVKDIKVPGNAEFLKILDEELLSPAIEDTDVFRRTARLEEVKRRLDKFADHLKTESQQESKFRADLVSIYKTKEMDSFWKDTCTRQSSLKSFAQMEKDERTVGEKFHSHLKNTTIRLQQENASLNEQVDRLEATTKEMEKQIPLVKARPYTEDKKVALLKKTVAQQDQEFIHFKSETESELRDCYRIRKHGLQEILGLLQAYTKRAENGLGGDGSDVTDILKEEVADLVDQVRKLKARAKQAGEHSSRLEQERGMALALLRVHNTKEVHLQDTLRTRLDELGAEINKLRKENDDLRRKIRCLEEEKEEVDQKYKGLQAKLSDFACASTESPSRRKSQSQYVKNWRP